MSVTESGLCLVSMEQGASGVGIGNFEEVGPLDTDLKPRNSTWLQKADLLFVVNSAHVSVLTSYYCDLAF